MAQTPRPASDPAVSMPASIDSPDMLRAGRELLSLALIDARNHTLHLLSLYEQALGSAALPVPPELQREEGMQPPVWFEPELPDTRCFSCF